MTQQASPQITIERTTQWANGARPIEVYINNEKAGIIHDGETQQYDLEDGSNEVYAKIDWCKTVPIHVLAEEGTNKRIELGSTLMGWKMLTRLYRLFVDTKNYLYLKEMVGS